MASIFVATEMWTMCSLDPAGSSLLSPSGPQFPGELILMDLPDQRIVIPCCRPATAPTRSRGYFATVPSASMWSSIRSSCCGGQGPPSLTEGWVEVDGVLVTEGRRQRKWLRQLNRSDQKQPLVESVTRTLEAQLVRQVERPRVTAMPQVLQHGPDATAH